MTFIENNMNINLALDKLLRKTLWIWLPFYGLYYLTKDLLAKIEEKK